MELSNRCSAGTTYDAFKLIHDAQKYGARVGLYGRKINNAEHQLAFNEMLRLITDGKISPEEAVRAYHGVLQGKGIQPHRPLANDLQITDQAMSYDGSAAKRATVTAGEKSKPAPKSAAPANAAKPGVKSAAAPASTLAATKSVTDWPKRADGSPDFAKMTSANRRAFDQTRLKRIYG